MGTRIAVLALCCLLALSVLGCVDEETTDDAESMGGESRQYDATDRMSSSEAVEAVVASLKPGTVMSFRGGDAWYEDEDGLVLVVHQDIGSFWDYGASSEEEMVVADSVTVEFLGIGDEYANPPDYAKNSQYAQEYATREGLPISNSAYPWGYVPEMATSQGGEFRTAATALEGDDGRWYVFMLDP